MYKKMLMNETKGNVERESNELPSMRVGRKVRSDLSRIIICLLSTLFAFFDRLLTQHSLAFDSIARSNELKKKIYI